VMLLLWVFNSGWAQGWSVSGKIVDRNGVPLPYATAVLLDPADSTLIYYSVSDTDGTFSIKATNAGVYLMQVAFIGYRTAYRTVSIPQDAKSPFLFAMEEKRQQLDAVEIVGEAVPLLINGDTIEYKRAAYKLQEGAVVEDLLRKLPGVEVDRAGNVKAMGEDVQQVYVDGKEFFGRDPKIATKNLPADAVDKVQVYDKKSDDAEFTGVDDGSREKSLNIVMDEKMKNILFGTVSGGGGIPSVYGGNLKAFYHTEKLNIAALGNINNINKPGFSLGDYMSFTGGGLSMMGESGSFSISTSDNMPVNFGQPVYGLNTSGAGGVNFSYSTDKYNRVSLSYMTNFVQRILMEERYARNYTDSRTFEDYSASDRFRADTAHILNFSLKRRPDTTTRFSLDIGANTNAGGSESSGTGESFSDGVPVNELIAERLGVNRKAGINGNGSLTEILVPGRSILKLNAGGRYYKDFNLDEMRQATGYFNPGYTDNFHQYQSNDMADARFSGRAVFIQKVGRILFLEPGFSFNGTLSSLTRKQGVGGQEEMPVDSLSPAAEQSFYTYTPYLGMRMNSEKNKLNIRLKYQLLSLRTLLNDQDLSDDLYGYLLPLVSFEHKFSTGRRVTLNYDGSINEPSLFQRIPQVNTLDPLYRVTGNPDLEPEYLHSFNAHLFIFDQFSFTSLFAGFRTTYTSNKISMSRTIDDQFQQTIVPVNVDYGWDMNGSVDFSTPVRKLGIKIRLSVQETYSQGLSLVNETENEFVSMTHDVILSVDNRVKKKWDLKTGAGFRLTDSKFSLRDDLDDRYYDLNWFGEITYTPTSWLDMEFTADIMNYNQESFTESILIPYLKSAINFHVPPSGRASFSLTVNDILNRDRGIQRISELNYLSEVRRNILGRYGMLIFTYRLNKSEKQGNNVEIEVHGGRRR